MKTPPSLLSLIAVACLWACDGTNRQAAVPRPEAFPRVELYDTAMTPAVDAPLHWLVNAQAEVAIPDRDADDDGSTRWLNIVYPRYGATVYCTFTKSDTAARQDVIDNRVERMSLNSGGNPTEIVEMENPARFHCQLLVTPQGSVTPLQFLATNPDGWVVSGAAYLRQMPRQGATDSIAPIIDALRADLIRALQALN